MRANTCLFVKPKTTTAAGAKQRDELVAALVEEAVAQNGLTPLGDAAGIIVQDISADLIKYAHEAGIVVIDANCYEGFDEEFGMSPFLYYLMALSHSQANKTILVVTSSDRHLPRTLSTYHTIVCDLDESPVVGMRQFRKDFGRAIKEILNQDAQPDNPIQAYRAGIQAKDMEARLAKIEAEIEKLASREAELAARERELSEKEARLKDYERELSTAEQQLNQRADRIQFRKVE